jgi:hypothetical protein
MSGSSNDPRRKKRTSPIATVVPSETAKRQMKAKFSSRLSTAEKVFYFLLAVVGIPSLISACKPHFAFSPQAQVDTRSLLDAPFLIRNTGYMNGIQLDARCEPKMGDEYNKIAHMEMQGVGFGSPPILLLEPGAAGTVPCIYMTSDATRRWALASASL